VTERINSTFVDSEDRKNYKIHGVCKVEHAEHSDADNLMYKYYNIDVFARCPPESPEDFEYTPCSEILTADWVTWTCDKEEWVMCCACSKWRRLPKRDSTLYPENIDPKWTCEMNTWDSRYNTCECPEEDYSQTVAVTEEIDGVAIPVSHGDTVVDNNDDNNNNNSHSNVTSINRSATARQNSLDGPTLEISRTMDLAEVLKEIFKALKSYPGVKLFTRLSPDTTNDILRIAHEEGRKAQRS